MYEGHLELADVRFRLLALRHLPFVVRRHLLVEPLTVLGLHAGPELREAWHPTRRRREENIRKPLEMMRNDVKMIRNWIKVIQK